MKIHNKKQPSPEQIAAMLEGLGVKDVSVEDIINSQENTEDRKMLAEEGTLLTLANRPHRLIQRKCKECKELFATDYLYVSYCSVACRTTALRKYGLSYKNGSYRHYHEPVIIPPDTLNSLRKLLAVEVYDGKITVSKGAVDQCPGQAELPLFEDIPASPQSIEKSLHRAYQKVGIEKSHSSALSSEVDSLLNSLDV